MYTQDILAQRQTPATDKMHQTKDRKNGKARGGGGGGGGARGWARKQGGRSKCVHFVESLSLSTAVNNQSTRQPLIVVLDSEEQSVQARQCLVPDRSFAACREQQRKSGHGRPAYRRASRVCPLSLASQCHVPGTTTRHLGVDFGELRGFAVVLRACPCF